MKSCLLLCFSLLVAINAQGQITGFANEGIRFETTKNWDDIIRKAETEDKLIFVDVWASWCGPCKRLAYEVFVDKEVGEYFNANFVNYKLQTDCDDEHLKDFVAEFSERYGVVSLPTLLWLDHQGDMIHMSVGYMSASQLLEEARKSGSLENNTKTIREKWAVGDRTLTRGIQYLSTKSLSSREFDDFYMGLNEREA